LLLNSYAIKECIVIRKRIPLAYFATVQSLDQERFLSAAGGQGAGTTGYVKYKIDPLALRL
jgi:hypothetical protein